MRFSSLIVFPAALAAASPLQKRDYPGVGACSGSCTGNLHDPSVVRRDDGTYFRFTTNDKIGIASAPSIAGPWTDLGSMLPDCSSIQFDGRCDLWAPDVFNIGGTYYAYYAVSTIGSQNSDIGLATSTTMEPGSWTDHGSIGIPRNDDLWNRIDPNLFQHDANSPYIMTFGSYWNGIYQLEMQNPPVAVNPNSAPKNVISYAGPPNPTEGSYQFWQNIGGTDFYYIFFSEGYAFSDPPGPSAPGEEYKVFACRSTSPTGGFVDDNGTDCLGGNGGGKLVIASHDNVYAPGGQGVFYDPGQGSVVMYYHYIDPRVGYDYDQFKFGWNKLDFSSGWPVTVA